MGEGAADDAAELMGRVSRAGDIAKMVKGLIVAVAFVVVLDRTEDPAVASVGLAVTVLAVMVGDAYALALEREIDSRQRLGRRDLGAVFRHISAIAIGATPVLVVFVLAWIGLLEADTASNLAVWGGIALLGALGFAAAHLRGERTLRSLAHGGALALIGVGVLAIESLHV